MNTKAQNASIVYFFIIILCFLYLGCKKSPNEIKNIGSIQTVEYQVDNFIGVDKDFGSTPLLKPCAVRQHPITKDLIITDWGNNLVYIFSSEGEFKKKIGQPGQGPGDLMYPESIAIDKSGNIYIYEERNYRISVFSKEGVYIKIIKLEGSRWQKWYFNDQDELIVNIPKRGYFISVMNKEGEILRDIGKIPEILTKSSAVKEYYIGDPFVDSNGRYYIFLEKMNRIYIFNKDGKIEKEAKFTNIIPEKLYEKYIDPEFLQPGQLGVISLIFQDVIYRNHMFYIYVDPVQRTSSDYFAVLDENLNFVKKIELPLFEGTSGYHMKIEMLDDNSTFIIPLEYKSEIIRAFVK